MSPLPRPVKDVLAEPALDASVKRVWAKVQLRRRVPAPLVRPSLILGGVLALAAFVVTVWPPPKRVVPMAPVEAVAEVCAPIRLPHPSTPHARRPTVALPRPAGATAAPVEADVVGALLMSVEDAAREGHTDQVVAILGEIAAHHTDDPRAVEALYMLGTVQLEVLKQPSRAAASFRRALELSPSDDLVPRLWEGYEAAGGYGNETTR